MGAEDAAFFATDFQRCRHFFTEQLGLPLDIYAFPNGSYRHEQVRDLLAWGIRHVLLVDERVSAPGESVHPRFTFFGSSSAEVRVRSLGWTRRAAGS
jgi:catechol 2,3-dioxygenase-like lactoylglutathione lyase family enzyme